MNWKDLLTDGYSRVPEFLANVLNELTEDDLNRQPRSDCNSIGWLIWHLTRQQDAQISTLMGKEQLWIRGGWHSKFNRPADPNDSGFGHTEEDLAAFRSPDAQTLLDYQNAAFELTKAYLLSLKENDLDRELEEPWFQPLPTVGVRLISVMNDAVLHAGQAAYVRGLIQGMEWQEY